MACDRCKGARWICEAHPWKAFPHDACSGPGEPCPECQGDTKPPLPDDGVSIASTSGAPRQAQPGEPSSSSTLRPRTRSGASSCATTVRTAEAQFLDPVDIRIARTFRQDMDLTRTPPEMA